MSIILGLGLTSFAAYNGGGLFQRGVSDEEFYGMGYTSQYRDGLMPNIPNHGSSDNEDAPLGTASPCCRSRRSLPCCEETREIRRYVGWVVFQIIDNQ
jgi:hypothetical protein